LKPEQWGSPLVQEKCQEEKACDKRHPYRIIIIIVVIVIIIIIIINANKISLVCMTYDNLVRIKFCSQF